MEWRIITVGKPALTWTKQGTEHYLKRLQPLRRIQWVVLKAAEPRVLSQKMLEASSDCLRVLLDETGRSWRSIELADWLHQCELRAVRRVAFVIGGADGHPASLRENADHVWSLSPLTLQHELALLMVMEQLYRADQIQRNSPYHREGATG